MADLYNSEAKLNGVFKGTNFALSLTSGSTTIDGAIIQDFSAQYQRQITRIYELGSHNQYFIEGPTQGNAAISQIVGPTDIISAIAGELADLCGATDRTLALTAGMAGCDGKAARSLNMGSPLMTNFQIAGSAANFTVSSSVGIMFTNLELA